VEGDRVSERPATRMRRGRQERDLSRVTAVHVGVRHAAEDGQFLAEVFEDFQVGRLRIVPARLRGEEVSHGRCGTCVTVHAFLFLCSLRASVFQNSFLNSTFDIKYYFIKIVLTLINQCIQYTHNQKFSQWTRPTGHTRMPAQAANPVWPFFTLTRSVSEGVNHGIGFQPVMTQLKSHASR